AGCETSGNKSNKLHLSGEASKFLCHINQIIFQDFATWLHNSLISFPDVSHPATHIESVPDLFNVTTLESNLFLLLSKIAIVDKIFN
ncbi:MAG: hypothetical protein LBI82_13260, partial [Dysgonamonadaceae bacterium]|nr:hypothetical protein [Dysgonamonadaceae bacterium]